MPHWQRMESQTGSGALADSPPAPDFAAFAREADAADLAPSSPPSTSADSSPAPVGDTPASDAGAADSPPAKPVDKPAKNLQTRTEQVTAEVAELQEKLRLRKALREELDAIGRSEPAKPASDPAAPAPKATWERYKHLPDAPKPEQFDVYEDYLDARAEFIVEKHTEARERHAAADRESRERVKGTETKIAAFTERVVQAREADPEFDAKVDSGLLKIIPAFSLLKGEPVQPANVLLQEIVTSEAATALLLHFSTPEGHAEWQRLAKLAYEDSPAAMIRAFGRTEARFLSTEKAAAAPAPAKPFTSAPAPPRVMGKEPPASPDRAAAATRSGSYRDYEAAANAADLAVRRR